MKIGKAIKVIRNIKGLSQKELCKKADISCSFLSRIEKGKKEFSLKTFNKLSDALCVDMAILISLSFSKKDIKKINSKNLISTYLLEMILENQ